MHASPRAPRRAGRLAAVALLMAATPVLAGTPAHIWSRAFGQTGTPNGTAVAVDASGNIFLLANFDGVVDFGGGNLTSLGGRDVFLGKYSAAGTYLWGVRMGGAAEDVGNSVAVDGAGDVTVTGAFTASANFGGSTLVSAGLDDIFIARYSGTGAHLWSKRIGSTGSDQGFGVATDTLGDIYTTGHFTGTVTFGGANVTSISGSTDIYLVKYSSAGAHQWTQKFGNSADDQGRAVATDPAGNVYLTGMFQGTVGFGGGNLVSAGAPDIFLAKFTTDSVHVWSQRFGNASTDIGKAIAVDVAGNVSITGLYNVSINFGGGVLASNGGYEIFLARFNNAGAHQWSRTFGSPYTDQGYGLAVDAAGNLALTGYVEVNVDFGGGVLQDGSGPDAFLAKFSAVGSHLWSRSFPDATYGNAVAFTPTGNVCATGQFNGTANIGGADLGGAGTSTYLTTYAAIVAEPVITSIADVRNDQGRQARITFAHSGRDQAGTYAPIVRYEAYRRNNAPPAMAAAAPGGEPDLRTLDQGWTEVASVHAHGTPVYSIDVPTLGDSTIALGQFYSAFFIRAASDNVYEFYDAAVDSGYSLDNLAPGVPANLVYAGGRLAWGPSTAGDFDYFTVYGANSDNFGAATVVDYSVAPGLDVAAAGYAYYFVTATDFAGNEGRPAKTFALSGVDGLPRSYVLSVANFPNPFNPSTTVSYTVPARGRVTVFVYDVRGARVATLVDGEEREPGAYRLVWDGRSDAGGLVTSGTYFARIEHGGGARSRKMVLLK